MKNKKYLELMAMYGLFANQMNDINSEFENERVREKPYPKTPLTKKQIKARKMSKIARKSRKINYRINRFK